MNEIEIVEHALKRAAARRRVMRAWQGFWVGLFVAGCVSLLVIGAYKLLPIPQTVLWLGPAIGGALLVAFVIAAALRKVTLIDTARWVDRARGLKERLSTAWELRHANASDDWKQLVTADAASKARELNPHSLLPLKLPAVGRWALLIVALAAGLGFVPEYRSTRHLQKLESIAHVRETARQLAEFTRRNIDERTPVLEPTQKALESVENLADKLSHAKLTRSEAARELQTAIEKLSQEVNQLDQNPALKRLQQAAREQGAPADGEQASAAQRQAQQLQEKLGKAAEQSPALDKAADALRKMQENLSKAGDAADAKAMREQIAQTLGDLAQQMRDMGQPLPDLEDAIRALENNQTDLVSKNIQNALQDLDKLREMAKALDQLAKQGGGGVGKDLPEQLRYGQTQAAEKRLQQMAEELKSGTMSSEQQKQMVDELERSVDPGSKFGNVGELLKQAAGQAQSGQKQQAAETLAKAAEELQKLNKELGDMQSLLAELGALDRAQMALMTGKKWEDLQPGGACQACQGDGCGQCKGRGWGRGGKPGAGVGTWADETGWVSVPDEQQPVDNSGITRPDLDPRGVSDRDANMNPNLLPTKVRGQMSQGGPMPSINLKGVSIKGQSTVQFEEAAATAQQEAQSALNQDKVPRAYQNAVRDYFDDIKK